MLLEDEEWRWCGANGNEVAFGEPTLATAALQQPGYGAKSLPEVLLGTWRYTDVDYYSTADFYDDGTMLIMVYPEDDWPEIEVYEYEITDATHVTGTPLADREYVLDMRMLSEDTLIAEADNGSWIFKKTAGKHSDPPNNLSKALVGAWKYNAILLEILADETILVSWQNTNTVSAFQYHLDKRSLAGYSFDADEFLGNAEIRMPSEDTLVLSSVSIGHLNLGDQPSVYTRVHVSREGEDRPFADLIVGKWVQRGSGGLAGQEHWIEFFEDGTKIDTDPATSQTYVSEYEVIGTHKIALDGSTARAIVVSENELVLLYGSSPEGIRLFRLAR